MYVCERESDPERAAASGRGSTTSDIISSAATIHFTECINEMVFERQLPHKIVNLLFTIANLNIKLDILWGDWLSKTDC